MRKLKLNFQQENNSSQLSTLEQKLKLLTSKMAVFFHMFLEKKFNIDCLIEI